MNKLIEFEDKGQDFLTWEINEDLNVIDCWPFQSSIWEGCKVHAIPSPGEFVTIETKGSATGPMTIKYKVEKVSDVEHQTTITGIHLKKIVGIDETSYFVNNIRVAEYKYILTEDFEKLTVINQKN